MKSIFQRKLILKKSTIKPPTHLRAETQRWWAGVNAEYALEPHHLKFLTLAAESWDRASTARETLAEHGLFYNDRWGAPRKHPAVSVAEAATIAFARLCRELDLSEDSAPDNRPLPCAATEANPCQSDEQKNIVVRSTATRKRGWKVIAKKASRIAYLDFIRQELWDRAGDHETMHWNPSMRYPAPIGEME
jgi:P27 family predicted phage terminase small subunit